MDSGRSRYLILLGAVAFVRQGDLGDEPYSEHFLVGDFKDAADEIESLLQSRTFIRTLVRNLDNEQAAQVMVRSGGVEGVAPEFLHGQFEFEVTLPRENQDLPEGYQGDVIETFRVAYDGLAFAVVARAPENSGNVLLPFLRPYEKHFASQVTGLLETWLSGAEDFAPVVLEPSPAFPAIWLEIELTASFQGSDFVISSNELDGDISVLVTANDGEWDADRISSRISQRPLFDVGLFYYTQQIRRHVNRTMSQIAENMQRAAAAYVKLNSIRWWQIGRLSRSGILPTIRNEIGRALERNAFMASLQLILASRIKYCDDVLRENEILRPQAHYFKKELERPPEWDRESLLRALRFYEEETRSASNSEALVVSVVIAALVSAAIAAIAQLVT